jgi:hypothetical protein
MRPSARRKWKTDDEPSPREKREMIARGEWQEEDEDDEVPNRAPLVFRLLAWTSLVVIFFAVGYGATSLAFRWLDNRADSSGENRIPANVVNTPQQTENLLSQSAQTQPEPDATGTGASLPQEQGTYVSVTISIPDGNTFKTRQIRCSGALREDTMKQTLAAYMDAMKEGKLLSAEAQDLNLFQSGDWLYLNMNGGFLESIKANGADKSRTMLTGMVKTMADNFTPINKIKFYVDGKEVRDKKPLDLTAPWGIRAGS